MKTQEIIEGNKLIAEFMGVNKMSTSLYYIPEHECLQRVRYSNECEDVAHFQENELKYHSSWDWLMPVVEKIIKTTKHQTFPLELQLSIPNIERTWRTAVEFIKWYNQNKN